MRRWGPFLDALLLADSQRRQGRSDPFSRIQLRQVYISP